MSRRRLLILCTYVYMQHKRHEAATGQRQPDKVVGLLSAEEVKEQERKAEAARKDGEAASEKNKGVYIF
jgi:hypothetical protein